MRAFAAVMALVLTAGCAAQGSMAPALTSVEPLYFECTQQDKTVCYQKMAVYLETADDRTCLPAGFDETQLAATFVDYWNLSADQFRSDVGIRSGMRAGAYVRRMMRGIWGCADQDGRGVDELRTARVMRACAVGNQDCAGWLRQYAAAAPGRVCLAPDVTDAQLVDVFVIGTDDRRAAEERRTGYASDPLARDWAQELFALQWPCSA